VFEKCVARYGKMNRLMTDGGSAFYCWNGVNRFQRLVSDEYGIDQIKASSPRSNGKVESVNKQIEKELLDVQRFYSLAEADEAIKNWVSFYNFERTHMGLPQGMVPADRFLYGWNDLNNRRNPVLVQDVIGPKQSNSTDGQWEDVIKLILTKLVG